MIVTEEVVRRVESRLGATVSGKWRLEHVLGIGGMASVYAAVHRNQNRVAIKMLHPEQSMSATVKTRFLREGYVANTVGHPGVVSVQDDGITDDGVAFLVMELLDGESLEDRRHRFGGVLPALEVLSLSERILEVLVAAHDQGILHRDIKPENLFLTTRGELKVLDFGIARLQEHTRSTGSGTSAGTFMGTPPFMSPEQARARWSDVDARSDIWAMGATMFVLLSGRLVHDAETVTEQLAHAIRDPAPPLANYCPSAPLEISRIVDKALAFSKLDRFQDARSMLGAVREAQQKFGDEPTRTELAGYDGFEHSGTGRAAVQLIDTMVAPSYDPPLVLQRVPTVVEMHAVQAATNSKARTLRRTGFVVAGLGVLLSIATIGVWVAQHSPPLPATAKDLPVRASDFPPLTSTLAVEPLPVSQLPSAEAAASEQQKLEERVAPATSTPTSAAQRSTPRVAERAIKPVPSATERKSSSGARAPADRSASFFDKRF